MALKDNWVEKIDGIDIASADDINQVATAVIELEKVVISQCPPPQYLSLLLRAGTESP